MKLLILILALAGAGCVVPYDRARDTLSASGFSDIVVGDAAPLACSNSDEYVGRHFTATNALGKPVRGVVCCGAFQSCTVRF